jgi:hypothetical protein
LNDADGLDMKNYLEKNEPTDENNYITTWSESSINWQDASPIFFLNKSTPPFLIYVGDKTYPSIKTANKRFIEALQSFKPDVQLVRINKKHIPMVIQYFWPWSKHFDEVIDSIKSYQNKN